MRPSGVGCGVEPNVSFSASCALFSCVEHVLLERFRLLGADDARLDEPLRVELAHGRMLRDRGGEQRLRVRGLVLLVVAVAAVTDEIDDDVVPEAAPVREREPDGRERGLGIVGVHMDDRDVEALREVARVARRAAVAGVGREADLVVRDQVQRAAGRVAGKTFEVERLRDLALARERRVAVDEDRQRDRGVVVALARRAVGLLGARASLDDRVDRFEMARVRRERHRDLARARRARALGAEVVLHVAAPALLARRRPPRSSARLRTRAGSPRTDGRRRARAR